MLTTFIGTVIDADYSNFYMNIVECSFVWNFTEKFKPIFTFQGLAFLSRYEELRGACQVDQQILFSITNHLLFRIVSMSQYCVYFFLRIYLRTINE